MRQFASLLTLHNILKSERKFGMCPGNLPKFAEAVAWVGGLAVSDDLYES